MQYADGRVPDFGPTVPRSRLLAAISRATEQVVVLTGPTGYGKSVLAAQLAQAIGNRVVWVDCSALECSREQLFAAVRRILEGVCQGDAPNRHPLMPSTHVSDVAAQVQSTLSTLDGVPVIVLDDVPIGTDLAAIDDLSGMLGACGSGRVILTTRWESSEIPRELGRALVVSAERLRLSYDECHAVLSLYLTVETSASLAEQLMTVSAGRAATVCVLARHLALGSIDGCLEGPAPLDLAAYLNALVVAQLDDRARRCLHVCALLRTGTIIDVERAMGRPAASDVQMLGRLMPLVSVDDTDGLCRFRVHDIVTAVYEEGCFSETDSSLPCSGDLLRGVLEALDESGRHLELFALAVRRAEPHMLLKWTISRGRRLLESGGLQLLDAAFLRLGSTRVIQQPRLLLLHAQLRREELEHEDALRMARVARGLASADGDEQTATQALLVMARLQMDQAMMVDAAESLIAALDGRLDENGRVLAHAYLGVCRAFTAELSSAQAHIGEATRLAVNTHMEPEVEARVRNSAAIINALLYGRSAETLSQFIALRDIEGVPFTLRIQVEGNIGAIHVELGRLQRAGDILSETVDMSRRHGLTMMALGYLAGVAAVKAGQGFYDLADEICDESSRGLSEMGCRVDLARNCVRRSVWTRATGGLSAALTMADEALEYCSTIDITWLTWSATLESAASLLALGDTVAASQQASSVREAAGAADAALHALIADLILAEIDRRNADIARAQERLGPHADYVLTESANWWVGMYVRTFPHLLGLLANVADSDRLPAYLLRMVLPQDVDCVLTAAREVMGDDDWQKLVLRLAGTEAIERLGRGSGVPTCKVRLFGGLEVKVGTRTVRERDWQKRKARLLFAMLVLKQGQDVPRDLIFEHLWPDKDFERARNNLYVIWSAMKAALMSKAVRDVPLPYAENLGGVCRAVVNHIESDITEFDRQRAAASDAERNGDMSVALRAYERLDELYRGELLPGDVYDDWFAAERSRYRIAFGDAMLKAAGHLERADDASGALKFAWSGVAADVWREDLYQCLMRNLATVGQRSAAIEVYMTCRNRLAEDLGLDPSSETMRLYEQILAMEDVDAPDA